MQSDVDIFIWIIQGVIGLLIAAEALLVSMEPELARRHRRALRFFTFAFLFPGLFGLLLWQGERSLNARRQGDLERQKFEQERRDSQAAFDRTNQDAQIERNRSEIERNRLEDKVGNLSATVKLVADTVRAQTLNGQNLKAQVSQNNSGNQIAEPNNRLPPQAAVIVSKAPKPELINLNLQERLPPLSFRLEPVFKNNAAIPNLYYFWSTLVSAEPDEDLVLSWDFGDGKPVTSRATEKVLHAFSNEHPFNPNKIQITFIGTLPRKQ
jgi:hypothetical protein